MKPNQFKQQGSTLLVATILTLVVSTVVGIAMLLTTQSGRDVQRTVYLDGAEAVGNAYLDWSFAQWEAICNQHANVPQPGSAFSGITAPPSSYFAQSVSTGPTSIVTMLPPSFTVSNFQVVGVTPQLGSTSQTAAPPTAQGAGAGEMSYYYLASADVSMPTVQPYSSTVVHLRRIFEKYVSNPWQYAIFYNDTLEFHPSPTFVVNGKVHSNGSIYASPDGGNSLTFGNSVGYGNIFYDGYAPGDWSWRGYASSAGLAPGDTFTPGLSPSPEPQQNAFDISPSQFTANSSNPNMSDGYRELIEVPVTGSGTTDPLSNGTQNPRYYDAAGIKVLVDVNDNVTVLTGTGAGTAVTVSSNKTLYNAVTAAVSATGTTITDDREAATVRLVNVDVSVLNTQLTNGNIPSSTWNGVLYVSDQSAGQTGGTPKRGVRIKNGATTPTGGITIVSDNAVYVQGDFNTAAARQPSAIAGDAINVLSNNWNDSNSSSGLSSRVATSTTINAAFLSGVTPTVTTYGDNRDYSGGVENFPRFHEDWSSSTLTYNGSMVELFNSKQAIGRWAAASYNPPTRNWAFDTAFLNTPPPGTLVTASYIKQRWYQPVLQ